jgi:hypothetical protein
MQASASIERLTANQLVFREVNERIREVAGRFGVLSAAMFICECGRTDCADAIELNLDEYDDVRSCRGTFVIAPGHESPHEQVVAKQRRHVVVMVGQSPPARLHDRNV